MNKLKIARTEITRNASMIKMQVAPPSKYVMN